MTARAIQADELRPGRVLTGTVTEVREFGAYVDIGAEWDGFVHISELGRRDVASVEDVVWVSQQIGIVENDRGWDAGSIRLLAIVETARGVVNLREIAASDPRLDALIFGAEDLAGDVGAVRTREAWEVFYARSAVVIHATAYNLQALDMVNVVKLL